ncbi:MULTISPECIES: hypothetical protein [Mycolicibacterium]|uniref:Uncharacterized protein n=1 Tax=Mycolicibacterium chlorophenolicum TaxID=37916 RepID=A0A0J6WBA4_9MYCO|nr:MULTISPECIES: hypothetical protein [Mycolicibacterium]KMO79854.1 hypothetical protein MCHLDSM_01738 [Mycolicibacterium chlorophenolicum]MCV7155512.1 hypothetical protein [Mycolicibacterium pyrenivorans]
MAITGPAGGAIALEPSQFSERRCVAGPTDRSAAFLAGATILGALCLKRCACTSLAGALCG